MAFSIRTRRLVSVGLAGVIAVGVIGVGSVAFADEQDGSGPPATTERQHKPRPLKFGVHQLLENSGVTRDEVKEGAAAGLTLDEIIHQYGDISADEAKDQALARISERLDDAVANGNLTQERAEQAEARTAEVIDRLLGAVPGEHRGDRPHPRPGLAIAKQSLETVAEVLGIDVATLREQLAGGATIAEVAGDQAQAVIDALVADAHAAIDQAVENGRLPAEKADEAKEKAAAAIERFVHEGGPRKNGERPFTRPGGQ